MAIVTDADSLIARTIRAERLALDMARVVAAAEVWRGKQQPKGCSARPVVRALVDAVVALNAAHPEWRLMVVEMGQDVAENPLEER